MYKVIGGGVLTWTELSEVLLDVETQINRRPLSYVEDDAELRSTHRRTNSPTPTRRRIKSSRDVGELVLNPTQLIRS